MTKMWFEELIEQKMATANYKQQALLLATLDYLYEQEERLKQAQGELDGLLWSPSKW